MIVLDKPTKVSEIANLTDEQKAAILAAAGGEDFVTMRGDYDFLLEEAADVPELLSRIAETDRRQAAGEPIPSAPYADDIPQPVAGRR